MLYLEYAISTKFVTKVHNVEPSTVNTGCAIYAYEGNDVEDTFSKNYFVTVDYSDAPIGIASYQIAPQATYFLQQLTEKDLRIEELQNQIVVMQDVINLLLGL